MSNPRYCRKGILIPWATLIDALKSYGIAMPEITEYIETRKDWESIIIYYREKAGEDEYGSQPGEVAVIDHFSWREPQAKTKPVKKEKENE